MNNNMKLFITIAMSFLMGFSASNNLDAQIQEYTDLILHINKSTEQQKQRDAQIFAAYGRVPYIPNKVDPTLNFALSKEKLETYISKFLLKRGDQPAYYNTNAKVSLNRVTNVVVTDDYLQFTRPKPEKAMDTITIFYKDILNAPVMYFSPFKNGISVYTKVKEHEFGSAIIELPDIIYYIQQYYSFKYYQNELEIFKSLTNKHNNLAEKPGLTEEQRKYFVQANSLAQNGDYFQAIELYEKGINISPFSYVTAYYNLGLIAAMAESYPYAIFCMKKYLILNPNASDARTSQDKIYEWEALSPKIN